MTTRRLMNDEEAAEYTGLSRWAINELRRHGQIPFLKPPMIRKYYFVQSEIDQWLNSLQVGNIQDKEDIRMFKAVK